MFTKVFFIFRHKGIEIVWGLFAIYIFGFSYGTTNHVVDIIHDGLLGYKYVPLPVNIYWTLLTILDPLTILLLLFFPFLGMVLSVLVMATDIPINLSVAVYFYFQTGAFTDGRLFLQIAFGLFVFVSVPPAWKKIEKCRGRCLGYQDHA